MAEFQEFNTAYETLRWSCEELEAYETVLDAHLKNWRWRHVVAINEQLGEEIVKIVFEEGLPSELRKHANSSLEHAKNAFDKAVYAACICLDRKLENNRHIYFPWANDEAHALKILKRGPVPASLHDTLIRLKPYSVGSNSVLDDEISRALAQLANKKHTVGLEANCNVAEMMFPDMVAGSWIENPRGLPIAMTPRWDARSNELTYLKGPIGVHKGLRGPPRFTLQVVLNEARPLRNRTFPETMELFTTKAQTVIEVLEGECARLLSNA